MMGITHALVGISLCKILGFASNPAEMALAAVFALLPDIDHPTAFIGKITRPLSIKIYSRLGHRNITHSILFMTVCVTPMLFTPYFMLAVVAIGSHLVTDAVTYMGIPFLWPYKKNFTLLGGIIKTGSSIEVFISIMSVGVILLL